MQIDNRRLTRELEMLAGAGDSPAGGDAPADSGRVVDAPGRTEATSRDVTEKSFHKRRDSEREGERVRVRERERARENTLRRRSESPSGRQDRETPTTTPFPR